MSLQTMYSWEVFPVLRRHALCQFAVVRGAKEGLDLSDFIGHPLVRITPSWISCCVGDCIRIIIYMYTTCILLSAEMLRPTVFGQGLGSHSCPWEWSIAISVLPKATDDWRERSLPVSSHWTTVWIFPSSVASIPIPIKCNMESTDEAQIIVPRREKLMDLHKVKAAADTVVDIAHTLHRVTDNDTV